jgi:hypothetical protein
MAHPADLLHAHRVTRGAGGSPNHQSMPANMSAAPEQFASELALPKSLPRWLLLLALAVVLITYIGTLQFQFVYDDHGIGGNQAHWRDVPSMFLHPLPVANAVAVNYYRPVLALTNFLAYQLFVTSTTGWHALGLLIHLAVTLLVYFLASDLTGDRLTGAIAATCSVSTPFTSTGESWFTTAISMSPQSAW